METMIHTLSDVHSVSIGEGTFIWQYCVVLKGAVIGRNCNVNCHVFIENDVIIDDNVTIKSGVQIWNGLRIESNVFIGPNVTFTNDLVPRSKQHPTEFIKTKIHLGASIGANSTIVAGNSIGEYSFIGAGSVITKDVEPFTVWYGNPAKKQGYITKEGILLKMNLKDAFDNQYIIVNNEPVKND